MKNKWTNVLSSLVLVGIIVGVNYYLYTNYV
jgi:hypothetical protein